MKLSVKVEPENNFSYLFLSFLACSHPKIKPFETIEMDISSRRERKIVLKLSMRFFLSHVPV